MKRQLPLLLAFLGSLFFMCSNAQENPLKPTEQTDSIVVDHKGLDTRYREDQFYLGLTFNILSHLPDGVSQSGFSGGLHLGFIRDFPINKRRNVAIGLGIGWSMNVYRLNMLISEDAQGNSIFQVLDRDNFDFDVNRFSTYLVEVPLQLRWRTSTASTYKFWRIYAGLRFGYIYYFHSKFEQPGRTIEQTQVDELNRFRYGATFTFGYNTFNFTVYYSLNSFFDGTTTTGRPVDIATFKVGLVFYIL